MKVADKQALQDWSNYVKQIRKAAPVDLSEKPEDKVKRIAHLEAHPFQFFKYYFPNYCTADFADFQKEFVNKVLTTGKLTITEEVARDHAKSTLAMMLQIYRFCKKLSKNFLLVSYSSDNAEVLLKPMKLQFENNQRLINDYGTFKGYSNWEGKKFVTTQGWSCRAIGLGQSPRGTKEEEERPDTIFCDDVDEDEMCRNTTRLDDAEAWMWGALFGCLSIEGNKLFAIVNNRIAQDCLLVRAISRSDYHISVNMLSKQKVPQTEIDRIKKLLAETKKNPLSTENDIKIYQEALAYLLTGMFPTWHQRFSIEDCIYMILKMGYILSQREYFNNPIVAGKHFKKEWFVFKKLPPISSYKFLIAYLDPGFKKTKTSDTKALPLVGLKDGVFHVRKVFCGQASIEEMIEWCYATDAFVKIRMGSYILYMEEVFLQSLLYKDFKAAAERKKYAVPVKGDTRKKPDKDSRILSTTGYFERSCVVFDEDIEHDHHTQELIAQYLGFDPSASRIKKDGPDAMEGAFHLLTAMVAMSSNFHTGKRGTHKHKLN